MERAVRGPLAAACLIFCAVGAAAEPVGVAPLYLQARQAALASDYAHAADHYARAVARDPSNRGLMESAVSAFLASGEADRAAEVARLLERTGEASQIAAMALVVDRASRGEWRALLDARARGREIGPLVDSLTEGWALFGSGEPDAALEAFRDLAASRGLAAFGQLHEALARAARQDWVGAERIFAGRNESGEKVRDPIRLNRRTALLRASLLSQGGRNDHAVALIDHLFGARPDPTVRALRARLVAGERLPYDGPTTGRAGVAEAFYTVATALKGDAANGYVLLYARAAAALEPGHGDAVLLSASLLRGLGRLDEAEARYADVAPDHPARHAAQLSRAAVLRTQGRGAEAVALLAPLGSRHPDAPRVQTALGDALRAQERHGEAVAAYDRAVAAHGEPAEAPWSLHYARAVSRERTGDWVGARADLGRALAIEPDEPRLLHHLGRSMVRRGEPLGEAVALIERAAEAAPEDGAVTGSLGWALYRMGRVKEAVEHLERAAVLEPFDAVLNDHLGDALWSAGRRREARFQWRRAITLDPDAEDAPSTRLKLVRGLDATLAPETGPVTLASDR